MKNARENQILENLKGLGTNPNQMYTNQEIIDRLKELQAALARGVFERTHAENLRDQDIMIHFEALAKERGLDISDTYNRFRNNMGHMSYTIGSLIKGMKGEQIAKRALKLLSFEKDIRVLYNVQLEDDDVRAEYDAIVVTPYGMFVVEIKNWGTSVAISPRGILTRDDDSDVAYDLPGRMSVKEALLREYLQDLFPANYYNMLLLPNERVQIRDEYHQISVSCGGGIAYEIKSFSKINRSMSAEQVNQIADAILTHHQVQRALSPVNCEEIIADYAALMAQIEGAPVCDSTETFTGALSPEPTESPKEDALPIARVKSVDWRTIAAGVAAIVIPSVVAVATARKR